MDDVKLFGEIEKMRFKMAISEWEWPVTPNSLKHEERIGLMRKISYELTKAVDNAETDSEEGITRELRGHALSINISSNGMLLLMQDAPETDQVVKVYVPTPTNRAEVPTLAEVRWVRKVPHLLDGALYFVGVKFIFA